MKLRTSLALSAILALSSVTSAGNFDECGVLIQDSANCILVELPTGQRFLPDDGGGGYALGAAVRITGTLDTTCVSNCDPHDGCIVNAVTVAGCAFDHCGVLVQDFANCILIELPNGNRYIPDDGGGGFPIGSTVTITGDYDPSCGSICGPNRGCIWNAVTVLGCIGSDPGAQYCPGDGVAPSTLCPCGNNNDGSMGGCDWGNALFPGGGALAATGSDSVAANDTYLNATGVENNFGIFFGAANQVNGGNGNPLNDGLRCAGGSLVRLNPPTMTSNNAATTPAPVQALDTGAAPGVTRRYQYWFRTPGGPCGQMANLTNGYEIVWGV